MADEEKNDETTEETPEVEETPAAEEVSDTEVSDTTETPEPEAAAAVEPETQEPGSENQVPESAPEPEKRSKSLKHVPRSQRRTRSKPVREKPKTRKPITRTEKPDAERGRRQERRGVVVSDKSDKTIVVKVDVIKSHPRYKKVVRSTVKFHAHDEGNSAGVGDTVRIVETRPLSKQKRWRLAEIVEKAQ